MTKAIIDTCVVIDALQKREPFWKTAERIFIAAAEDEFVGIITAKRISADCIVTRNFKDYKNSPVPVMSPEEFITAMNTN